MSIDLLGKSKREYIKVIDKELEIIRRGTIDILPEKELRTKLEKSRKSKKALVIKTGFDPSAPDLHLGHLVLLRKMRQFQDLGHQIHFLIGDFTGRIGDPTGRSETRVSIAAQEVEANAQSYCQQLFKVLDKKKTKICYNSTWCKDMKFEKVLELTSRYTVARLLERDDFLKRYKAGESISLIEFMYPLLQGYDSVMMKADLELGGSDQKFNLLVGRELQSSYGLEPQVILTMPLLVGLDGQHKMSKSYNNYIAINEAPYAMFAKCMSLSDELMWDYFNLLTDIPTQEIEAMREATLHPKQAENPMKFKKLLGSTIVDELHGIGQGEAARKSWEKEKGADARKEMVLPPDVPEYCVPKNVKQILLIDLLLAADIEKSKSAVRRLIQSGSIKLGTRLEVIEDLNYSLTFPGNYAIKIGKKRYLKVKGK